MRKIQLALIAFAMVAFASCGKKGITPVTEKIDGPLGEFFEVVSQDYKVADGTVTIDLKRVKEGLPTPWEESMELGAFGDNTYEMTFMAEFLDNDGKSCADVRTDVKTNASDLTNLAKLKVGETGHITLKANLDNAKQFKLASDFAVRQTLKINLSGTLNNKIPICVTLHITGEGMVRGAYYYKKNGPKALLYLKGDKQGDKIHLCEYNKNAKKTGEYVGNFNGTKYSGEFEAFTGKSYSFDLNEDKSMEMIDFSDVDFDQFVDDEFYEKDNDDSYDSGNIDELLDRYERYVNDYVKVYKKSMNGDMSVAGEVASLMEECQELTEAIEEAEGSMTQAQLNRFNNINKKFLNALQ